MRISLYEDIYQMLMEHNIFESKYKRVIIVNMSFEKFIDLYNMEFGCSVNANCFNTFCGHPIRKEKNRFLIIAS